MSASDPFLAAMEEDSLVLESLGSVSWRTVEGFEVLVASLGLASMWMLFAATSGPNHSGPLEHFEDRF